MVLRARNILAAAAVLIAGCGITSQQPEPARRPEIDPWIPCVEVAACSVTVTYPASGATNVEVRGDFAPDGWDNGIQMTREGDQFVAEIEGNDGQSIAYKFVVDGNWVTDPNNPDTVPDGLGGENSVLVIDCPDCDQPVPTTGFQWSDGVMYFVLVDRFFDGNPGNDLQVDGVEWPANYQGGDLEGVRKKIEDGYFTDLGVSVLWLSAPMDNADGLGVGADGRNYSSYHGYWPSDLETTEDRVGSLDDLEAVVKAAHEAGIKVVLDYVMNHVHEESPLYADHPDWFWPLDFDGKHCVCGEGCSWEASPDRYRCWFRDYLPDFDFTNPAAREWSVNNALNWAKNTGIDGYRLDAVKHIEMSWLTDLRSRLRQEVEGDDEVFYLVGETYTGERSTIAEYVDPMTKLDGQFDFPLRAELVSKILMRQGTMNELANFVLENDDYYGPGAVMGTFIGNHDVPRSIHHAEDAPMFGTNPWADGKDRAWSSQPGQPAYRAPYERMGVAFAFLLTSPGMPLIYYGDEIGLAGAGDPDNRRFMPWSGLSEDQLWLRDYVSTLTKIRAAHPVLSRGERNNIAATTHTFVYEMRDAEDSLYVALNRDDVSHLVNGLPSGEYQDLLTGEVLTSPMDVPRRSARILRRQ